MLQITGGASDLQLRGTPAAIRRGLGTHGVREKHVHRLLARTAPDGPKVASMHYNLANPAG